MLPNFVTPSYLNTRNFLNCLINRMFDAIFGLLSSSVMHNLSDIL